MNLIPWRNKARQGDERLAVGGDPWRELDAMVERFFAEPWSGWTADGGAGPRALSAPVDLSETEDELVVRAELPGVAPEDLELTLEGDVLTFSGEKKDEHEERRGGAFRRERRFGSFRRSVQLPGFVDTQDVQAEHRDGVVTVRLKKSERARPRRIEVRAGNA